MKNMGSTWSLYIRNTLKIGVALLLLAPECLLSQKCYVKTQDFAYGNFFVKAVTDSTCFGQLYDTLYYQNYRTQQVYYRLSVSDYFGIPSSGIIQISDIIVYDSLIVIDWEKGTVFRILKHDRTGRISEVESDLDKMPWLKYQLGTGNYDSRKIRRVNDSIAVLSSALGVYSFIISNGSAYLIDSLSIYNEKIAGDLFDVKEDTMAIISKKKYKIEYYNISSSGKFVYVRSVPIITDFDIGHAYYGHGHVYLLGSSLDVLMHTDDGFVYRRGVSYLFPLPPLILPKAIAQLTHSQYDRFEIYEANLVLKCVKDAESILVVNSCSNYKDAIFIASANGITKWIPDSSLSEYRDIPDDRALENVEIWPSPTSSGVFMIGSTRPILRISIRNILGKIVYTSATDRRNLEVVTLLSHCPGKYFITVELDCAIVQTSVVILN